MIISSSKYLHFHHIVSANWAEKWESRHLNHNINATSHTVHEYNASVHDRDETVSIYDRNQENEMFTTNLTLDNDFQCFNVSMHRLPKHDQVLLYSRCSLVVKFW